MKNDVKRNPALATAHLLADDERVHIINGVQVKLRSVPAGLIDHATARVKDPDVPIFKDEETGKEYDNPTHPQYEADKAEAARRRGSVALDTMILHGVVLVDGLPEDGRWLKKLQFQERLQQIDLSEYNLGDEIELEFVYLKFGVVNAFALDVIGTKTGLKEEAKAEVRAAFPNN